MRWYKRDPNAWLAGVINLTMEERGAYDTVLEVLYSRDGEVPPELEERIMCAAGNIRPQMWRRLRDSLFAKGKLHRSSDGKLTANRVETTLKEARNFSQTQVKRARNRWVSGEFTDENTNKNNVVSMPLPAMPIQPQPQPQLQSKNQDAPAVHSPVSLEADLFRRGKEVLKSPSSGGLIKKVLIAKNGDVALARAAIEMASTKGDPREYLGAIAKGASDVAAGRIGPGADGYYPAGTKMW